ncbi:MAG: phage portal protein [Eubacterium sp.]
MSNLADSKKRKFEAALNRRYRVLFSNPACPLPPDSWIGIDYEFTKNLPANVLEESEIARNLEGIVPKETQLKVLSVVDNVQDAMDRLAEEGVQTPMIDPAVFERSVANDE